MALNDNSGSRHLRGQWCSRQWRLSKLRTDIKIFSGHLGFSKRIPMKWNNNVIQEFNPHVNYQGVGHLGFSKGIPMKRNHILIQKFNPCTRKLLKVLLSPTSTFCRRTLSHFLQKALKSQMLLMLVRNPPRKRLQKLQR